jgi:GRASP55/65 PDZ-like domain
MCEPEFSLDSVWHVLDVLEGSPAESAGLVPYGDWIIGWSGGVLSAEGDFYDIVEAVSVLLCVRALCSERICHSACGKTFKGLRLLI